MVNPHTWLSIREKQTVRIICKCYLTLICSAAQLGVRHPQVHVSIRKIYCLWARGPLCLWVRRWLTEYVLVLRTYTCVCSCVCAHAFVTVNMSMRECVRESLCACCWCYVCMCTWTGFFLSKRMHSTLCEGVRLYIFALSWKPGSRGYCCALCWSRVNSSLTPIHYGPLLLPSWCSTVRQTKPPSFTHNVNQWSLTHKHGGGDLAPGEKYYLWVRVFKCEFMHTCKSLLEILGLVVAAVFLGQLPKEKTKRLVKQRTDIRP